VLDNREKSQRIRQYPTGPMFLNPLVSGTIGPTFPASLIAPWNSLFSQKNSLIPRFKFPVNFTGIFQRRSRNSLQWRGLSG